MKEISLENFGDALSSLSSAAASVQNGIAHALAKEIQERAKGKIGEYQPASHGFDAWHHSLNLQWISAYQLATQRLTLSLEVGN